MRVCRKCGNLFAPSKAGQKLCSACDPVVTPFPPAPIDLLIKDVREGYGNAS